MPPPGRFCVGAVLLALLLHGALAYKDSSSRRDGVKQSAIYPQNWKQDYVADHDRTLPLARREIPSPLFQQGPGTGWSTYQRGSATIPRVGASVRVSPERAASHTQYRGRIVAKVTDGPKPKKHRRRMLRQGVSKREGGEYKQGQPKPQPCARCPGDRAVLAPKGSNTVLMDTPPIIPCHSWSSIKKVKSEVVAGPQPGTRIREGGHKVALRIYRHKRTLATCVIRYNVIVRKCPELHLEKGVEAECSLGRAWGSSCNLTCGPGYRLEGDSTTECSDSLEWTGSLAQCIQSTACQAPATPENGHLSCRTPHHRPVAVYGASLLPDGTVCQFRCQSGYQVPPALAYLTKIRCVAGSWDLDQDPICEEINEVADEEEQPPEVPVENALRLGCFEDYCLNGGKCVTLLEDTMCSCLPGYSGSQCEGRNDNINTLET